ncbi:MAG: hypothetical protein AAGC93_04995 [Cyanobacteria bacterium P01_F01_bin.53]
MSFRASPMTDLQPIALNQPMPVTQIKRGLVASVLSSLLCSLAVSTAPAHAQALTGNPAVQPESQPASQTKQVDETAPTEAGPAEEAPAEEAPAEGITTGLNPGSSSDWQRFTSEEGAFSVSMPSQPAAYTFTPNTDTSEVLTASSRMYMQMQLVSPHHLEIYAAAFIESDHLTNAGDNVEAALLSCVSSLSDDGALRTTPTPIAFGHHHGVEAEFLTPEGSLQVSRCYLAGDRAYMLTATSELFSAGTGLQPLTPVGNTVERSHAMDTFFNSFEILN